MPFYCRDPVTDEFLISIVKDLPSGNFSEICLGLGWSENQAQTELKSANNDYTETFKKALTDWKNRIGGTRQDLVNMSRKSGL